MTDKSLLLRSICFLLAPAKNNLFAFLLCLCVLVTGCTPGPEPSSSSFRTEEVFGDPLSDEQWYLDALHIRRCWESDMDGTDVLVAVLDSGLDFDHPDLAGAKFMDGYNATGIGEQTDVTDYLGHGTFVTGLLAAQHGNGTGIKGLMPDAVYLPIKVTDTSDDVGISAVLDGLKHAVSQNADVVILSLGLRENIPDLEQAVQNAADAGALLFAAVGNDGGTNMFYPAAYECVIGVGSCNSICEPSETSQRNKSVFVLAPGVEIISLWSGIAGGSMIYSTATGTSYAVPQAAAMGIAAKMIWPDINYEAFMSLLSKCAQDIDPVGYDESSGWGLVDFDRFCDQAER